jgi:hypothetical protein
MLAEILSGSGVEEVGSRVAGPRQVRERWEGIASSIVRGATTDPVIPAPRSRSVPLLGMGLRDPLGGWRGGAAATSTFGGKARSGARRAAATNVGENFSALAGESPGGNNTTFV